MKKTLLSFGVIMVALVAVIVAPSPYEKPEGGIVLYGDEKKAEVYGPKLPETIVGGYTQPTIQSVVLRRSRKRMIPFTSTRPPARRITTCLPVNLLMQPVPS